MHQSFLSKLRSTLRTIPFIYQAYGFVRRIEHEIRAIKQTWVFKSGNGKASDDKPIPPPKLRFRVHGDLAEESFMKAGAVVSSDISRLLSKYSTGIDNCGSYLDFGCGCARVLRHFFPARNGVKFFGTDIDGEAIQWNSTNFGQEAQWSVNSPTPPMLYDNEQFDVIVSISVFTHLDEELQNQWLSEIARILAPTGIAILSVHGDFVWKSHPNIMDTMTVKGFKYLKNYVGFWRFNGLPDFYQISFQSRDYIYKNWTRYFDIISYEEAAIDNHQAAVIVRKKASTVA